MDLWLISEPNEGLQKALDSKSKDTLNLIDMTGLGRAVYYSADETKGVFDPKSIKLKSIFEGQIVKSVFQGYARQLTASGFCQAGFWGP